MGEMRRGPTAGSRSAGRHFIAGSGGFDRLDLRTREERSHRARNVRRPSWVRELAERVLSPRQQYPRQQYPRWGKDKLVVLAARIAASPPPWWTPDSGLLEAAQVLHEPPKPALLPGAAEIAKTAVDHSQA
jgi:hypothetical protein